MVHLSSDHARGQPALRSTKRLSFVLQSTAEGMGRLFRALLWLCRVLIKRNAKWQMKLRIGEQAWLAATGCTLWNNRCCVPNADHRSDRVGVCRFPEPQYSRSHSHPSSTETPSRNPPDARFHAVWQVTSASPAFVVNRSFQSTVLNICQDMTLGNRLAPPHLIHVSVTPPYPLVMRTCRLTAGIRSRASTSCVPSPARGVDTMSVTKLHAQAAARYSMRLPPENLSVFIYIYCR